MAEEHPNLVQRHSVLLTEDHGLHNQKPLIHKNSPIQTQPASYLCWFCKTVESSTGHPVSCVRLIAIKGTHYVLEQCLVPCCYSIGVKS